jgi:hypothetical protein
MFALLASTVGADGIVVPSKGLAPLRAPTTSTSSSGGTNPTPAPTPISLAGTWNLSGAVTSSTCKSNPSAICSQSGSTFQTGTSSGPIIIQQNGTHLVIPLSSGTPTPSTDPAEQSLSTLTGTITGNAVTFGASYTGPETFSGVTVHVNASLRFTGTVESAKRMSGTFTEHIFESGTNSGVQFSATLARLCAF